MAVLSNLFSFTNSVLIENALFTKNTNSGAAGRMILVSILTNSTNAICKFSNLVFSKNGLVDMLGAGFIVEMEEGGKVFIDRSEFIDNTLEHLFTGLYADSPWITNCAFERNTVARSLISSIGYGEVAHAKNLIFSNTYTDTTSLSTSALRLLRRVQFNAENINFNDPKLSYFENNNLGNIDTTSIRINNSILHGSQSLATSSPGFGVLSVSLSNSSLYNTAFTCAGLPPGTCGPGMIEGVDPMFVDPASGDFRLQPCSPLVNAGDNALVSPDNTTDLAGKPRIAGGRVDMGAYETPAPNLLAAPDITPACPGTSSGSAAFQPENGCPPYEFVWSALGSGSSYTGLPAGAYTVTITDARGSAFSASFTVPGRERDRSACAGAGGALRRYPRRRRIGYHASCGSAFCLPLEQRRQRQSAHRPGCGPVSGHGHRCFRLHRPGDG